MIKTTLIYLLVDRCLDLLDQNINMKFYTPDTFCDGRYKSVTFNDCILGLYTAYDVFIKIEQAEKKNDYDCRVLMHAYGKSSFDEFTGGFSLASGSGIYSTWLSNVHSYEHY